LAPKTITRRIFGGSLSLCGAWEAKMADTQFMPSIIALPSCPKCGARMTLVHIFPDRPGYDQRTYECHRCEHEITEVIEFPKADLTSA
jgi:hypothetical protein